MDENDLENKASSSLFSRFRSPTFQQNEVKALLKLIEKNKDVLLNKCYNSAANNAKERAWSKAAIEFNKLGLGPTRTMEMLKTKWENLKRNARKLAKDVMDDDDDFSKDELKKTIMLICTAENIEFDVHNNDQNNSEDDLAEFKPWPVEDNSFAIGNDIQEESATNDKSGADVHVEVTRCNESSGFSPRDCRILLQCVRKEKKVLFSDTSTIKRQHAWKRIAEKYNTHSSRKKTAKELSRKFNTMKCMARKANVTGFFKGKKRKKYEQLSEDEMKIKSEPIIDCATDAFDFDSEDNQVLRPADSFGASDRHSSFLQDPLNNAQGSDSGLGGLVTGTKDTSRLKLELLNYRMETARLERKRIEEAIKGDIKEREMRAAEQTLRLRAARLAVAAAEDKLPPSHPALCYTAEEASVRQFLSNSRLDVG